MTTTLHNIAHDPQHHFTLRNALAKILSAEMACQLIRKVDDKEEVHTLYQITKESHESAEHILRSLSQVSILPSRTRDAIRELRQRGEVALGIAVDVYWAKFPEMLDLTPPQ